MENLNEERNLHCFKVFYIFRRCIREVNYEANLLEMEGLNACFNRY